MADLAVWQRTIVDEEGNVVPGAEIEVRREEDDSLATLYADRAGETPLANPLAADMSGFVRFFAQGDAYTITAVGAGSTRTWRFDPTGRLQEFDRVSEALVADDAADLLSARSNLGTFSTVADVQSRNIPAVLESIDLEAFRVRGDLGQRVQYIRGVSAPTAIQSADGSWWDIPSANIEVGVGPGGDFPTMNAAIKFLCHARPDNDPNFKANLVLTDDFEMKEQLILRGVGLGWIRVRTESGQTVSIARDALTRSVDIPDSTRYPAFAAYEGAVLPYLDVLFQMDAAGSGDRRDGFIAHGAGSSINVAPGGGLTDVGDTAVYVYRGSVIQAVQGVLDRAGVRTIVAAGGKAVIDNGSGVQAGARGLYAYGQGVISAQNYDGHEAGERGAYASSGGSIFVRDADLHGCGSYGVVAQGGGYVSANGTNCQRGVEPGYGQNADICVLSGGFVSAWTAIGGTSQPANFVTQYGLIIKNEPIQSSINLLPDTVGRFYVPFDQALVAINSSSDSSVVPKGIFWVRTTGDPRIRDVSLSDTDITDLTTGALNGTTGTAGRITISVGARSIYIENRRDASISISLQPISLMDDSIPGWKGG